MRLRSPQLPAALAALALLAAGCGGDDGGDDAGDPLTKAEFIEQADRICQETNAETSQEVSEFLDGAAPTAENLPDVAALVASGIQDQVSGIEGLSAPEGDEEQIQAILDKADEGAELIREDPDSLGTLDVANPVLEEANQLAVDYGLKVCGEEG